MTTVLCLNVGSSSVKAAAFSVSNESGPNELARTTDSAKTDLQQLLSKLDVATPDVVAHRVVHGGPVHAGPAVVDDMLIEELRELVPLAPLHMPPAIAMIELAMSTFPNARHVACFDTAFHRSMPEVAKRYALPDALTGERIQRYGFHGLSCEHVVAELGIERSQRLVIAHLGNGCSLTAVRDGKSIDTTMGFTPAGGVIMGTRAGDVDPGLLLYLLKNTVDIDRLAYVINFESGLLALGGHADMQTLLLRANDDGRAARAVEAFCYRIAQQIGAYAIVLDGIETLVFTGGIGEHAEEIRRRITASLEILQPFETIVVRANEELVMARHAAALSV